MTGTPSFDEDGLTVIRQAAGPAEPASQGDAGDALPVRTMVSEFEVKGVIGAGGFGIVYLAHDHSLGRDVALKEYLPVSIASRSDGVSVWVRTNRHAGTFAAGLASFINEARLLAQFDSPSLVKVYRFWEANGTAYMVMPYYEGPTLKQALLQLGTPPSEHWLKELLVPLMEALDLLHQQKCFHRDIAPDNILLPKGGPPVLLDFGAARRVIEDEARALTVILKPGFAPVEQYADMRDMRQGAWTDIYALAAVVHYAITGKAPPPSVSRIVKDTMVPLRKAAAGVYSDGFLAGLDRALAVKPEARPQSILELRRALGLAQHISRHDGMAASASQGAARSGFRMRPMAVGLGALAFAAAVGSYFALGDHRPAPSAPGKAGNSTAPATVPAIAQPTVAPVSAQVPATEAAPPMRASMADALAQLHKMRDASHEVVVRADQTQVRIGKDKLKFRIQSDKSGYLYVFMLGTDNQHVNLLFPNSLDSNNRIVAKQPLRLPRSGWDMTASGPSGTNQFVAMVSELPRDFNNAGLAKAGAFGEFSKERIESMLRSQTGGAVLAGVPKCAGGAGCSTAYGAAMFTIVEVD